MCYRNHGQIAALIGVKIFDIQWRREEGKHGSESPWESVQGKLFYPTKTWQLRSCCSSRLAGWRAAERLVSRAKHSVEVTGLQRQSLTVATVPAQPWHVADQFVAVCDARKWEAGAGLKSSSA